jgi:WD40 repeat protein
MKEEEADIKEPARDPSAVGADLPLYDAFASYATDPDSNLVRDVESFVESLHQDRLVPKEFREPLALCVDGSDFRIPRSPLGTNRTLEDFVYDVVRRYQAASRCLVVFSGPRSLTHPWINKEVDWWYERFGGDRVYFALTHGQPRMKDGSPVLNEVMPDSLAKRGGGANPIWFDLRGFYSQRTWTREPRSQIQRQLRHESSQWRSVRDYGEERTRLAAQILSEKLEKLLSPDDLIPGWRAAVRARRRRSLLLRLSVIIGGLIVLGTTTYGALRAKAQADSATLANQSRAETDQGWHDRALRLAVLAARRGWLTPPAPMAEAALARAAQASPLIADLRGHEGPIVALAYSFDGNRLATASEDSTTRVWDVRNGAEIAVLRGHGSSVNAVMFSPDGSQIATASSDSTVRLWDARTGNTLRIFKGHGKAVTSVVFDPSGERIASGSADGTARLWEAGTGVPIHILKGHEKRVGAIAFRSDGKQLATASDDGSARLWDVTTGRELRKLCCHRGELSAVAYGPDGRLVATSGNTGVRVWDTSTGQLFKAIEGHVHPGQGPDEHYFDVKFSRTGSFVAAAGAYASALLVNLKNGNTNYLCCHDRSTSITWTLGVAVSPLEKLVATAGQDGSVRLWDATGSSSSPMLTLRGSGERLNTISFNPDGRRLAEGGADGSARIWDVSGGQQIFRRDITDKPIAISDLALIPDSNRLVVAGPGPIARVLDTSTLADIQPAYPGHTDELTAVAVSPDKIQFGTASKDKTVRLWKIGGEPASIVLDHPALVNSLSFSPDGLHIATGSKDGRVRIWDTGTKSPAREIQEQAPVTAVAYSASSRLAIATKKGDARIRDTKTGNELMAFCCHEKAIRRIALSPDGLSLATASEDFTARIWDIATGALKFIIRGHTSSVTSIAYSPDSTRIATGGGDAGVRLWDSTTGADIALLRGTLPPAEYHWGEITGVLFFPDGTRVATSGLYKTVAVWPVRFASELHGEELINAVCAERLSGGERVIKDPTGNETRRQGIRRIAAGDISNVSGVLGEKDMGVDVCAAPTFWEEGWRAIRRIF